MVTIARTWVLGPERLVVLLNFVHGNTSHRFACQWRLRRQICASRAGDGLIDHRIMGDESGDLRGAVTRDHHGSVGAKLVHHRVEQAVDARRLAQDHAGLHGGARARPITRSGARSFQHGQTRRGGGKRTRTQGDTRGDDASGKGAGLVHDLDIRGRPQIHHDHGSTVGLARRHRVGHTVGTNFGRSS